ncbi:Ppx/GppA phosphatase family protein [Allorhizocola rhizosphaerae]|uniref:Ppx/GppA phosphatase family protein n=1 Tax=Allorhizocola rhizosphaerae TaxID=1872709 RepID=UPI000E3D5EB9|nr:Ppx/GppA phosphatase family protein [Allorhizocola rhizosphaerae]
MTDGPVAAIDCGTNSIRLLITDGKRDIARLMRIVRLGQGVDRTGRLDPAAIERTRAALSEYARLIDEHAITKVRMVATSATRDAANAGDFHDMVRATLGHPAEVISGREEAALSFSGAVAGLPPDDYLVVDIGGGSTEFVRDADRSISVDIGCVRMTERHLHSDPPTEAELSAATEDIAAGVRRGLSHVDGNAHRLVGLAGSVTTVAAIALGLPEYDPERVHHSVLTSTAVEEVTAQLSTLDHAGRAAIPVIHPGRVDVIVAGSLVLREILRQTGFSEVIVSEHDILDGIAASLS